MKKFLLIILSLLFISLLLVGCNKAKDNNINATKNMDISKVEKYNGSYVGDNNAVSNIIKNMPGGVFVKKVSLETQKTPYMINIEYRIENNSKLKDEDLLTYWDENTMKNIFLNNATTLFILIKNVDVVTFNLDNITQKPFSITRKDLEKFYGKDLKVYSKDTALWKKEVLEETLKSDIKIKDFYSSHNIALQ